MTARSALDLIVETTTTEGTGTLTLAGALTGFLALPSGADGQTFGYSLEDASGTARETGVGVYTHSGRTFTRSVIASTNSNAAISLTSGTHIFRVCPLADLFTGLTGNIQEQINGKGVNVQVLTVNETWTKPAGATDITPFTAIIIAGGGGGGSGRRGAAGTHRYGGGGGQGGGKLILSGICRTLGSTEAVVVGSGGAGGASVTSDNTNGTNGTAGGNSSFGGFVAVGGTYGRAGTDSSAPAAYSSIPDGSGGPVYFGVVAGSNTPSDWKHNTPTNAGNSGYINSLNNPATYPSEGVYLYIQNTSNKTALGGAAGTVGDSPTPGGNGNSAKDGITGTGGGGGGFSLTGSAAGQPGGDGGLYGGGGGGGGPSNNGLASGAGGDGGDGIVIVITYL